ncbi:MAG: hypothetical protein GX624_12775 [Actinobacteria bacterium]|nr:hypothetical protein [Actinomycetota bacterium]
MTDEPREDEGNGAPGSDEQTEVTRAAPAEAEPAAAAAAETQSAIGPEEAVALRGDEATVLAPSRRRRLRSLLIGVLVVLTCLSVVVTGLTLWSHYTVMDTEGYMALVGPVGKDPKAIQRLSEYIGGEVVSVTDLQRRVTEALPARAQLFAGPITAYVEDFIVRGARKVLSSPRAYQLWLEVNRAGHEKVVALLRGETTGVYIQGSDVKLNLLPLISHVIVWVDERLPGGLSDRLGPPVIAPGATPEEGIRQIEDWSGRTLPSDFGQITLLQSDALGPAQTAVKWFDRLTWVLPMVTAALVAATIWLSRRRARTAIALGVGAAVAFFIARVIVARASLYLADQVREGEGRHVVREVVDAALGPLTAITVWICAIGVVVAVIVWLLGCKDVREVAVAAGKRAVGQAVDLGMPESPVASWVAAHVVGVRWGVLAAGLVVLALVSSSWLGIFVTIGVVVLAQGVLSLVARQWPFGAPGEDGRTVG